jgi:hypothetical protein
MLLINVLLLLLFVQIKYIMWEVLLFHALFQVGEQITFIVQQYYTHHN